jgi:hypothetical protein
MSREFISEFLLYSFKYILSTQRVVITLIMRFISSRAHKSLSIVNINIFKYRVN